MERGARGRSHDCPGEVVAWCDLLVWVFGEYGGWKEEGPFKLTSAESGGLDPDEMFVLGRVRGRDRVG